MSEVRASKLPLNEEQIKTIAFHLWQYGFVADPTQEEYEGGLRAALCEVKQPKDTLHLTFDDGTGVIGKPSSLEGYYTVIMTDAENRAVKIRLEHGVACQLFDVLDSYLEGCVANGGDPPKRTEQPKDAAEHVTFPAIRDGKNLWVCSGCDITWPETAMNAAIQRANDHPPQGIKQANAPLSEQDRIDCIMALREAAEHTTDFEMHKRFHALADRLDAAGGDDAPVVAVSEYERVKADIARGARLANPRRRPL